MKTPRITKQPPEQHSIILMPSSVVLPTHKLNPKYESVSALSLFNASNKQNPKNRRRSVGSPQLHRIEYKDNCIILSEEKRRKSESCFMVKKKLQIKPSLSRNCFKKTVKPEPCPAVPHYLKKKGRRRNSYSLNHINTIDFLKANNSMLCVPESTKSKKSTATKSLSELSTEMVKSMSNVSSKSAIEMLCQSYNKLFSSKTKLATSFYNIDQMDNTDEPDLLVPKINNEYLKAPQTKRSRSNSSSFFTSNRSDKSKRSSSTKEKNSPIPAAAVKYLSLDQSNNMNKQTLNTNISNNEM